MQQLLRMLPRLHSCPTPLGLALVRGIHARRPPTAAPSRGGGEESGADSEEEGGGGGGRRGGGRRGSGGSEEGGAAEAPAGKRRGRPFMDPAAPRRVEAIRKDPMHGAWGGMIDVLEHSTYNNVQREEAEEGFFFDNTRPEFDSDEDGDPFSAAYLTEDEYEFPEDYKPEPYTPGRLMDAIWHSYTTNRVPIPRLVQQYAMPSYKISAIINLKANEARMRASGRYDERLDAQLTDLYSGRFGSPIARPNLTPAQAAAEAAASPSTFSEGKQEYGNSYALLKPDEAPEDAMPLRSGPVGNVLRVGHSLPRLALPPKAARAHDSKFVFRDVSGRGRLGAKAPLVVSDINGAVRPASNKETLYRSWHTRAWTHAQSSRDSTKGWPFGDAEEDEARGGMGKEAHKKKAYYVR